ncbi:MAG: zinc-binding dehydrogenase [Acidimicrobiia bacterium]|nr:zinc-binding dehydrogenase [Acidimicrobiia bacterium]
MSEDLNQYRQPTLPSRNLGWNMYGAGVDAQGADGKPEPIEVGPPDADQLLIRIDAVGLCYSDAKLVKQGGDHPKLYHRDLANDPTRLGHEATVTILDVGEALTDRFTPGQRLAVNPDIHTDGRSTAYGYTIPGALIRYHLIGPEVLDADDGSYVIPIDDSIGYAAAALSEPWGCVEAAYTQRRRLSPLEGGVMWVLGRPDDPTEYQFSEGLDRPGRIITTNVPPQVMAMIDDKKRPDTAIEVRDDIDDYAGFAAEVTGGDGFDDIVLLDPRSSDQVEALAPHIAFRGILNLVGTERLDGMPGIDVGRIHYHYTALVGNPGPDIAASYGLARNRSELKPGGITLVVGAGGPMGQMHMQRAIELDDGPRTIIASDLDEARLAFATDRLAPLARAKGIEFIPVNPAGDPSTLADAVAAATGERGADDIILSVPVPAVMEQGAALLAPDGMLVLFAGVPNGSLAALNVSDVYLANAQFTGTSGLSTADQRLVLDKAKAGTLSPQRSLGAVGSIEAVTEGLQALIDGTFPGKVMIFPQLTGLPLTGLDDLAERHPDIGSKLAEDGAWTTEAEAALIDKFWQR